MATRRSIFKRKALVFLIFFIAVSVNSLQLTEDDIIDDIFETQESDNYRDAKFFGLFHKRINKGYSKSNCLAGGRQGHCVKRNLCTRSIGYIPDPGSVETGCGFGGTCCILNATCWPGVDERIVKNDLTYLEFGRNTDPQACSTDFKFPKQKNVCQLKLEFKTFDTAQPDVSGNCAATDSVVFKADNLNPSLTICGNAHSDHHLYLHYGESAQISVGFVITRLTSKVEILVKQIKCDDQVNKAPEGCAQYYTARGGMVQAFNNGSQQLNNQYYSACVKGSHSQETITWTRCSASLNDFNIVGPFTVSPPAPPTETQCFSDYVNIPGSEYSKYCLENSFNTGVKSSAKPFILYVNMNGEEMVTDFGPIQASTGCPVCFIQSDGACGLDPDPNPPGCVEKPYLGDSLNTGFCLRYTRS